MPTKKRGVPPIRQMPPKTPEAIASNPLVFLSLKKYIDEPNKKPPNPVNPLQQSFL